MSDLPLSVLVVDDQEDVVDVIRRGLVQSGHAVTPAYSGEEGLEKASAASFDVIVLDIMLPGMSGFEVAQELRDRGVTTPILMLTARDERRDPRAQSPTDTFRSRSASASSRRGSSRSSDASGWRRTRFFASRGWNSTA